MFVVFVVVGGVVVGFVVVVVVFVDEPSEIIFIRIQCDKGGTRYWDGGYALMSREGGGTPYLGGGTIIKAFRVMGCASRSGLLAEPVRKANSRRPGGRRTGGFGGQRPLTENLNDFHNDFPPTGEASGK